MERMRGAHMEEDGERPHIHLRVSSQVHEKLFDTAADRQMAEPDDAVSYHAGAIVDEALRKHFGISG